MNYKKLLTKWNPNVGDCLTGRILYFEKKRSFVAIVRTGNEFLFLPAEIVAKLFNGNRPPDGSIVTIEYASDGYFALRSVSDPSTTVIPKQNGEDQFAGNKS
ncbi:MAG: hypothetical protein C5B54_08215 [Acidobacteria bacterium]|nr:MAG: hypothetical protein C5B54_08215 [Acidobacteriota bacterium]